MKAQLVISRSVVVLLVGTAATAQSPPEKSFPLFVGASVCTECHASDRWGPPQLIESSKASACTAQYVSSHANAYQRLYQTEARSIAKISGVAESPTESLICLDCHAAGADDGPRWWRPSFRIDNGVQCEACHGPGSGHVEVTRTADSFAGDQSTFPALPPRSLMIQPGSRERCAPCHLERPSHQTVIDRGFRLAAADRLYKTPSAITPSPTDDRLYVVCEQSNSLIEVDPIARRVLREVEVGKRPFHAAVSPDGSRAYVANRLAGTVSVVDLEQFRVLGEFAVGHEPHGVVVRSDGRSVAVLNTGDDTLSLHQVDEFTQNGWAASGQESAHADVRSARKLAMGSGPWAMAVDSTKHWAYVTNVRPMFAPFRDPPRSEITVVDLNDGLVVARHVVPEANMLQGIAWVPDAEVALFTLVRSKNLVPTSRLAQGWVITNGLGILWPDGRIDQVLLDQPTQAFPDPMDVVVSPDGRHAVITSGGADEIALIDVSRLLAFVRRHTDEQRRSVLPNQLGSAAEFVIAHIPVGANPRGTAFAPNGRSVYVANALDDTVTVVDVGGASAADVIPLNILNETTELRRGQRLFHSASITYGRQFSCRSCHPDGHTNGLTFDIEADGIGLHPVDNRTLRGILDTPPFKWEGTNPTLHRQCGPRLAVFFTRLEPYSSRDLEALMRYISTIEQPPNRYRRPDGLTDPQRRGKAVFERTTRNNGTPIPGNERCAACHDGAYRTNRRRMPVGTTMWFDAYVDADLSDLSRTDEFGELGGYFFIDAGMPEKSLDVAHLRNIADSPPYLHNGAAATLEELWTRFNMVDRHGATADLTRKQLNDLIAYLKAM